MIATADPVAEILARLPDHRKAGDGWSAKCPVHDDRHASLSIKRGDNGGVVLYCHAKCDSKAIVAALGMTMADLFIPNENGRSNGRKATTPRKIAAVYSYVDPSSGETLYEKVRYQPKDFRQRKSDGKGGYIYSLGDVKRVLYRLSELNDSDFADLVFLCNGEKAAEALRGGGLVATCTCDGEAKWRPEYTEQLRQRRVVILIDNDDTGTKHGEVVGTAILPVAAEVRVVALPGLPAKGDVYDYLAAGHTVDELVAIAEAAPLYKPGPVTSFQTVRELMRQYPELRPEVIRGLLRRGETMNIISSPKMGKSWLVNYLAICVATGRQWLGTFQTVQGDVLIIDNELHGETTASRIPRVAEAMGISVDAFCDHLFIENVRGKLRSIFDMQAYFEAIEPGRFKIIILDAFYRFLPVGSDENDNATMANIYNLLDRIADRLGCCFILIHHSSKGNQSNKDVTSVGAGAGSQSRATDTHLILRPHEEDNVVVLDAAVRSNPPINPVCLKWEFPLFHPEPDLDPSQLRQEGRRRRPEKIQTEAAEPVIVWGVTSFVAKFISLEPRAEAAILIDSEAAGLSERKAKRFLDAAIDAGKIFRWTYPDRKKPHKFSTAQQPLIEPENEVQE